MECDIHINYEHLATNKGWTEIPS